MKKTMLLLTLLITSSIFYAFSDTVCRDCGSVTACTDGRQNAFNGYENCSYTVRNGQIVDCEVDGYIERCSW